RGRGGGGSDGAGRAGDEVLRTLGLAPAPRALFEVYPQVGAAKLYRRYAQLRNFYYLDLVLAEVAGRLGVSEWTVRCMLPEEVAAALRSRRPIGASVRARTEGCLYALLGEEEYVLTGDAARELRRLMHERTRPRQDGPVLRGCVASRGKVVGPCKVVIRADAVRDFPEGAIVVSESTDP